jgi:hypothetical protein
MFQNNSNSSRLLRNWLHSNSERGFKFNTCFNGLLLFIILRSSQDDDNMKRQHTRTDFVNKTKMFKVRSYDENAGQEDAP